jgi:hypothetical protein
MNAQIVDVKGRDIIIAYHPEKDEPALGEALIVEERRRNTTTGHGLVVQVIGYDSAGYPGEREAVLAELLESAIAERHELVRGEPAMVDLKEIKLARCKIRKSWANGVWADWTGAIPTRNVTIRPAAADEVLQQVIGDRGAFPIRFARYGGQPFDFDASKVDKVNVLVGVKGSGKSHTGKLLLTNLVRLGAPSWVFDINKEFLDLPGADAIRVGDNYRLCLQEVGFSFLRAVVDDMGPLQQVSEAAFENEGPRFMEQEIARTGFATIDYLIEKAEQGFFHSNAMVNEAIETRLKMVKRTRIFADDRKAPTLAARFEAATAAGGFLVFDLAELPPRRLTALVRGLTRRLEAICEDERRKGSTNFPFVFFEEAHFYAAPEEILNLITRGRHLGLTTFFITNSPGQLPEVVFRQLDNMFVTGLSHSADLRTVAKCSLSDEETLQSLAMGLGPTNALVVGRLTGNFPLVVDIDPLPVDFPATGQTRTFWSLEEGAS